MLLSYQGEQMASHFSEKKTVSGSPHSPVASAVPKVPASRDNARSVAWFAAAIGLLLAVGVTQVWTIQRFLVNDHLLNHTNEVLTEIESTFADVRDAEFGLKTYVLMDKEGLPSVRQESETAANAHIRKLRQLTSDNPNQQHRLDLLEPLIAARFSALRHASEVQKSEGMAALREFVVGNGKWPDLEPIRKLVAEMEREERRLLEQRTRDTDSLAQLVTWIGIFGTVAALLLVGMAAFMVRKRERERLHAERQLHDSEERFRRLIDQAKDYAIYLLDTEGRIASWNAGAERIKGYQAREIIGEHMSCFYLPEDRASGKPERDLAAAQKEGRYEERCWRVRKDGSRFWANVLITALLDSEGRLAGFSKITRDLTERKLAEDQIRMLNEGLQKRNNELDQLNKELESFTYSVSHDLRAPLRHIDGFTRILLEDHSAELSGEARDYFSLIRDGTREMSQLVDDLLNLARVGRKELALQVTDFSTLVEEVISVLKAESGERAIEWRIQPLPFVECDRSLMKHVFINLLSNAVKFTGPRQPAIIEVGSIRQGDNNVIFVRDNGVGFDMKHVGKLFGVFQRLHRQEDFEGTGIGLAIVQRIVHKHGGRVWAEAELNKGACFYFTLSVPEESGAKIQAEEGSVIYGG
jgi:PAS domain S-box-containing protein